MDRRELLYRLLRPCVCWIVAALALSIAPTGVADVSTRDRLLTTSTPAAATSTTRVAGEHLWWVMRDAGLVRLMHSPPEDPSTVRMVAEHTSAPEGIAAFEDRVWLVFPPVAGAGLRRDVLARRVDWNPATKLSFVLPPGGEVLPSLPGEGDLVGFAADHRGVWALYGASPAARSKIQREGRDGASQFARLLHFERGGWEEITLPERLQLAEALASGPDGLIVIAPESTAIGEQTLLGTIEGTIERPASDEGANQEAAHADPEVLSKGDVVWTIARAPVPMIAAGQRVEWFNAGGRLAYAERVNETLFDLNYWRDGASVRWATVDLGRFPMDVGSAADGAILLRLGEKGGLERSRVGATASAESAFTLLEPPGFGAAAWMHLPLIVMLAVAALMIFAFIRAVTAPQQREPLGFPILSLERRVVALMIDAVPAALVAMIVFRVPPTELLYFPSWTVDLPRALPAMTAMLLLCVHTAISEWLRGMTLGKRLVGGAVVSADGSPPTLWQAFVRGVFKAVVLGAPILSIFILLQRDRRGIGDIASGTVVIATQPDAEPE